MSKRAIAVALAQQGFHVFPLKADNTPAHSGWYDSATADPDKAHALWTLPGDIELDANIGIATGKPYGDGYLCAIDLDEKNGKSGSKSVALLEALYDPLPGTRTTRTPSGGRHKMFISEAPLKCSVSKLGTGIDVRGRGGLVVAPGSTRADGAYEIESNLPIAPAPQWLATLAGTAAEKAPLTADPNFEWDTPEGLARAEHYLKHEAPPAIEGEAGDLQTYEVFCRTRELGIAPETALEMALEYYNERCEPPWDPDEMRLKAASAYKNAQNAPGSALASYEFEPVDVDLKVNAPKKPPRLYWKRFDQAEARGVADELVEGWIDAGAMSVWYGNSNVGKTFVLLSVAHALGSGQPWNGHKVKGGLVVYIAAEGGHSIETRLMALRQKAGDARLAFIPCPVDLLHDNADTRPLTKLIDDIATTYGEPPTLIVVDTLSRALAGGNENASDDMGALVKNLDTLRARFKAHMAIVHHKGKNEAAGARGHSLLRAATDTEIEIADGKITATKQRDKEAADPIAFRLQGVTVGTRSDGSAITSCVVEFVTATEFEKRLSPGAEHFYKVLMKAIAKKAKVPARELDNSDKPGQVDIPEAMRKITIPKELAFEFVQKSRTGRGVSRSTLYSQLGELSDLSLIEIYPDKSIGLR